MDEVPLEPLDPAAFDTLLPPERAREWREALAGGRDALSGRTLWHVNSTATGGGVAEMLQSVLCYLLGAGIAVRWLTVDGNEDFFVVTKRIHHLLHGQDGDGGDLDEAERKVYEDTLAPEAKQLGVLVESGDVVVLHDPQSLGLAPALAEAGASVVWACHVGADEASEQSRRAWDFLRGYAERADALVFSRSAYIWEGLPKERTAVIPPCIDAFSAKNCELEPAAVAAILNAAAVVPNSGVDAPPRFRRQDGSSAEVSSTATMIEQTPVPPDVPLVLQVSRWDPLKDHEGVMRGFLAAGAGPEAHLVLAGPSPESVSDDPEGGQVLDELREAWGALPESQRDRVHLACLPMADVEENAAVVNALQRRAAVVIQKSLAEGFGLTVAEAMWKSRPTIGARVGGIQDQLTDGSTGLLVDDPEDTAALGAAISRLLEDPGLAERIGAAAHEAVIEDYLAPCYLSRYLRLVAAIRARRPASAATG